MQFIWYELFLQRFKVLKSLLMHWDINFKLNRDNQITTHYLGIILLSNISITNSIHYLGILISEI